MIVLQPKNNHSPKKDKIFRFDKKSDDFLRGYKEALEEVMDNYNVYLEEI